MYIFPETLLINSMRKQTRAKKNKEENPHFLFDICSPSEGNFCTYKHTNTDNTDFLFFSTVPLHTYIAARHTTAAATGNVGNCDRHGVWERFASALRVCRVVWPVPSLHFPLRLFLCDKLIPRTSGSCHVRWEAAKFCCNNLGARLNVERVFPGRFWHSFGQFIV